ncbi:MAG TPA: maleylpyruvate isomerase N-terminal domain-containing protein [Micromonosporaceae bacterium]|nr:maleylpyruvate isomerase N-terminal domain-containing protein [Micromonosporaceae bacterium]
MQRDRVMAAFNAEAQQLSARMFDLTEEDWSKPTACEPWSVAELLGHVVTVLAWLPGMLEAEAPSEATVSAVDYYRPDSRFSPETNTKRIELARSRAAAATGGRALVEEFDQTWQEVYQRCAKEPADRVVRTRHGDAMLLTDFLVTRVVEVAVHGLDLAAALDRPPWLTDPAGQLLVELLLGPGGLDVVGELGWDRLTFLYKATGREPITAAETAEVERRRIRWLALG